MKLLWALVIVGSLLVGCASNPPPKAEAWVGYQVVPPVSESSLSNSPAMLAAKTAASKPKREKPYKPPASRDTTGSDVAIGFLDLLFHILGGH